MKCNSGHLEPEFVITTKQYLLTDGSQLSARTLWQALHRKEIKVHLGN